VRFTFREPFAAFPAMTGYNAGIVPKHALAGQDLNAPADFMKKPIGTGPFRFKEAVAGSHVTLEANPDFWDGKPQIDQLVLKVVPDFNAEIAQLKSGELDFALVQPRNATAFEGDGTVVITTSRQANYFYVTLNNKDELFGDVKVRRALNYAVDKPAIIKAVLRDRGEVATGPISPLLGWAYTKDVTLYPYDVAKAKALLDEAGWKPGADGVRVKGGKRFEFNLVTAKGVPDGEQLMTIVQQYLKAVGVDAKPGFVEFGALWTGAFKGDYQATVEYLATPPDPDLLGQLGCNAPLQRFHGYCDPALDKVLVQGRSVTDTKARAAAYAEAQRRLSDNPPGIYLYYPTEMRAATKRLSGVPAMPFREALMYASRFSLAR
jgi:peptide/nickel transport system substrate-binding protein